MNQSKNLYKFITYAINHISDSIDFDLNKTYCHVFKKMNAFLKGLTGDRMKNDFVESNLYK
jgi:hypothetical protein